MEEEDPPGTRTGCCVKKRYIWLYIPCALSVILFVGFLPTFVQMYSVPLPGQWPSTSCNVTNVTLDYVHHKICVQFRYLSDQTGEEMFYCNCIKYQTGSNTCNVMDCPDYNVSRSVECVYDPRNIAHVYFQSEVKESQSYSIGSGFMLVGIWGGILLVFTFFVSIMIKFPLKKQNFLWSETYDFDASFGEAMKIPRTYRPMFLKDMKSNETVLWSREVGHPMSMVIAVLAIVLTIPCILIGSSIAIGTFDLVRTAIAIAVLLFPFANVLLFKNCFVVTNYRVVLCSPIVIGVSVKWIEYHDISRMSVSKTIEFSRHGSLHVGNNVDLIVFRDLEDVHSVESIVAKFLHPSQIKALYGEMPAHFITNGNPGQQWEPVQPKTLSEQQRSIAGADDHSKFVPIFKVDDKLYDVSYPIELSDHIDRQTYINTITAYNDFITKNKTSPGQYVAMVLLAMTVIGVIYIFVVASKQEKAKTAYIANMNALLGAKGLEFKVFTVGTAKDGMLVL